MGNIESSEIEWFVNTLQVQFGIIVDPNLIVYEAVELGLAEVEDFFVPTELFDEVPATLLYETMIFDDDLDNVWVGAIAFYPNSSNWCLEVITKNGEVVFRKVLNCLN